MPSLLPLAAVGAAHAWAPRAMRAADVAHYLGVSAAWWLSEVGAKRAPAGHYLTARIRVWLREEVDAWLDQRLGRAPALVRNPWDTSEDDGDRAA